MDQVRLSRKDLDAVVFDMDGVVTRTAVVHAAAWKRLFDVYLERHAAAEGTPFVPFDPDADYRTFVDGKPRYDGVDCFLRSRGIELPWGETSDPPEAETVCGLGNSKNEYFRSEIEEHGVRPFETTVELVRTLQANGFGTAIISASRNAEAVLGAAGVGDLFPVRVDGLVAEQLGLPGKPDPAVFIEAARRVGAEPARTAIVEDAIAGVAAGRSGAFKLVIGVDRSGSDAPGLLAGGADVVVGDLGEVEVVAAEPPLAAPLMSADEIVDRLQAPLAVFLDYDGTLTPIVNDPAAAFLPAATKDVVERLAKVCPVAIVSGRDLADVKQLVGIDGLVYSGSHGYDLDAPMNLGGQRQVGDEYLADLDAAEQALHDALDEVPGVFIERKRFAIAIHYRNVDPANEARVDAGVGLVAPRFPKLRRTGGKKVFELRPGMAWDKGSLVLWLLEQLSAANATPLTPLYIGDDVTDEDAFRAIAADGIGVRVGERHEPTAAHYVLADTEAARLFLGELVVAIGRRSS
ncbi:MAG: trehalose-phosphatase [Thermoleophilia bacterium]